MSITRVITDIPPERVNFVIPLIRADGGKFEQQAEPDGEVTIIATFPNALAPPIDMGCTSVVGVQVDAGCP